VSVKDVAKKRIQRATTRGIPRRSADKELQLIREELGSEEARRIGDQNRF
jgi:hypothetical protein